MVYYNEAQDQSEKFGWKKVCDEHVPNEAEQRFWGNVIGLFALATSIVAVFLHQLV